MKKAIAILLAGLFAFALFACGDKPPAPILTTQPGATTAAGLQTEIYFAPGGVRIEMGVPPTPVLNALGAPTSTLEVPSCALKAKDIRYIYPGFLLDVTYPEEGEDYITALRLTEDMYTVPGGITIKGTLAQIEAAYGTDYDADNGFYKYTKGKSTLEFSLVEGEVRQIRYNYLFDAD